jgi:hypothetical protein
MTKRSQYLVNKNVVGYNVIKCDEDFNYIEGYMVTQEKGKWFCDCPNTLAPVCRHMKMIEVFKKKRAIGKGMFYCYDTGEWTKVKEFGNK